LTFIEILYFLLKLTYYQYVRPQVRLVDLTDFQILEALSDGRRNVAANIAIELDKDRAYLNTRLPELEDYGLIKRIGPAENSGLYEITEVGQETLDQQYKS